MHRIVSGSHFCERDTTRAAATPSFRGRSPTISQSCLKTSFCSSGRQLWPRCGPSPPAASRVRQHRCPAQSATASAAAAVSLTSEQEASRGPWPQIRRLALTAGCCIAWLWVASTFQSASPFAAISLGLRSSTHTGESDHQTRLSHLYVPPEHAV